ncbi:MAG TPA: PAS domain-containing protein, partial [Flavobacteriales bacterium]|nr:PAS domain-containing protein [Flavobacteriales bacterium]
MVKNENIQPNLKVELTKSDFYRRMIEEIQDYAIILLDKSGCIMNWNKGAQKIKQYQEEEVLGKHFSIFYFSEDLNNNLPDRLLKEAVETGRAAYEGWRKRKDGSGFWGSITITSVHDEKNTL